MSWPGNWHSKTDSTEDSGDSFANDNGILCLTGDKAEEYLFIEDIPPHLETHA